MYIVSVGSNPTGSTMPAWRRREIYDICVEYDIIICQDEPYYFLQHQPYVLGEQGPSPTPPTAEQFKAALEPSFLHFDYQGRVIHLDSFSKTLAPGCRLGFFVANPVFIERLTRAAEVEIQAPNGWSQAIVSDLLGNSWGVRGYLTWLAGLSHNYTVRRNEMVCPCLPHARLLQDHALTWLQFAVQRHRLQLRPPASFDRLHQRR